MFCPFCGAQVASGSARCASCSADMPAEIAAAGPSAVRPTTPASAPSGPDSGPSATEPKPSIRSAPAKQKPPAAPRARAEPLPRRQESATSPPQPRHGVLDFPLSTYGGQGRCDLCAAYLSSADVEFVSGDDMHLSAMNGFRGSGNYRDPQSKSFIEDSDKVRHSWWELCPNCHRRMLPYFRQGWQFAHRLRFSVGMLLALAGLAAGLVAFRLWFSSSGDLETRIWSGVLLGLAGLVGGGLAGILIGQFVGHIFDQFQTDPAGITFGLGVIGAATALYIGWDFPKGAADPAWTWWKVGIGGGGFVLGLIVSGIGQLLVKQR